MTLSNAEHAAMHNALETADAIMKEASIKAMEGEAYWTDEVEKIQQGREALNNYEPNPLTHAARYRNEQKLTMATRALNIMDVLLERTGFELERNKSWTEDDREVIRAGLEAGNRSTQHCRN